MLLIVLPSYLVPLLSAVVGAVISGGAAAAVAMVVLRRTQAHQSALATKQLDKQREGLLDQLQEQRREAALAREIAARADLVALLSKYIHVTRHSLNVDIGQLNTLILAEMQRWIITLSAAEDCELRAELSEWRYVFPGLQMVTKPGEHFSDGRAYSIGTAEFLQGAAVNYRETIDGTSWTSALTAERLSNMRRSATSFVNSVDRDSADGSEQS